MHLDVLSQTLNALAQGMLSSPRTSERPDTESQGAGHNNRGDQRTDGTHLLIPLCCVDSVRHQQQEKRLLGQRR